MSEAVLHRLRDALKERYLVERELGEGGAATVYLARDIRHERHVAVKVLRPEIAESLGAERFSREIRTAANLSNPHILTVLDSGAADGLLYYVMPYAEGESLRMRIVREGGLPVNDAVRILREVADALSTAHAAGVVHRDIKPDNVLLSGRHALVADFGVAKAISDSTGRAAVTTMGIALGTPSYMAPEQAAADPHVDHRADIYALGILGYEMLVGEPPFVRRTAQEVLAAHVTEPAPPVSARRPSVPPALDAMIAKCLAKQPGDRYRSADEILAELERITTPSVGMSPAAGMEPTRAHVGVRLARGGGLAKWGIAVAAVVALLAAGYVATERFRNRVEADMNVVAVFPFEYSGAPDLAYLREGIVNVLEANLTGDAGPRALASQTIIAQWKRRGGHVNGLTEGEALALARELGAGQILRGSIVSAGSDLVISATLSSADDRRSAQAQVTGPADSIAMLAGRLASQLLSLRVGEAADRLAALQSVPPSALRAYLIGQQALRESRFIDAWNAFTTALGFDSTFALAAMGLATAQSWSPASLGAVDAYTIAFRHRDRLGPRDLIILEMTETSRFAGRPLSIRETMEVRERLVQQVPDRPEGWYLIGDAYFHRGAAMGLTRDEALRRARHAFARVLALDPGVTYVKWHLAQEYLIKGDLAGYWRITDSLRLRSEELDAAAQILGGDSTDVSRYRERFARMNPDQLFAVAFSAPGTRVADYAAEQALAAASDAGQRRRLLNGVRGVEWAAGRPQRALETHERLRALARNADDLALPEVVLAALFEGGDSSAAHSAAAELAGAIRLGAAPERTQFGDRYRALVVGLWASNVGDSATAAAALRRLEAIAARRDSAGWAAQAALYAQALRLVGSDGPNRAVLASFDSTMAWGPPATNASVRSALNIIAARSWERVGEYRRAAAAAERAATWDVADVAQAGSLRDLGRTRLAAGDTAGAVSIWREYLTWRGGAEPSQKRVDDEIRGTLDRLERRRR